MSPQQSKASWLGLIRNSVLRRKVPRWDVITAADWREDSGLCVARIQRQFPGAQVAVRSSRHDEGAGGVGQAGHHRSIGPVAAANRAALMGAIKSVFASYDAVQDGDEVLVQAWVGDGVATLGVTSAGSTPFAGTASLSYYVGESTNAVTAGWTNVQRFWLTKNSAPAKDWPSAVRRSFELLATLEKILGRTALELEIAIDSRGRLRLLQVTPSTRPGDQVAIPTLEQRWQQVERRYRQRAQPRTGELGRSALFGLMPDWNTAELLGEHPRPLALSLFNELIGNAVWRRARVNLGYRAGGSHPLLARFAGRPYVDVRASLNSLIPGGIPDAMALPVIEAGLEKLRRHPDLHDRVETDLFPTCTGFADEASQQLREAGLSGAARRSWQLALGAMEPRWLQFSRCAAAGNAVADAVQHAVTHIDRTGESVRNLIASLTTIRKGLALPFAMHARLAFVARFQLTSLVTAGALSQKRLDTILAGVSVFASIEAVSARQAGALRPATFDIRVQPFRAVAADARTPFGPRPDPAPAFRLTTRERSAIRTLLTPLNLNLDADAWIQLAQRRIELRERWKYGLSQAVSCWLSALTRWGERNKLSADALSFLTVGADQADHSTEDLRRQCAVAAKRYDIERTIKMPLLLTRSSDLRANIEPALRPTFVGRGRISGPIFVIGRHTEVLPIASGAVVLIRAADPGFDWIFAYPLAALITCYGGPHSHMAIRCAELDLPCVLGCGETVHGALRMAACASIDFDQRHLMIDA